MKFAKTFAAVLLLAVLAAVSGSVVQNTYAGEATDAKAAPSADEQVAALETMCSENADAMAARQTEKALYERLGGDEKIHEIIGEVVRLHLENSEIAYLLDGVDTDQLVNGVALFIISGTGGPSVYEGPSLTASHAHMKLTNADFMAAGGDIVQAMKNLEYGENEINELVCAFVSLRDQVVVTPDGGETAAKY